MIQRVSMSKSPGGRILADLLTTLSARIRYASWSAHFHSGYNMPGYLPETDPETFETWEDAQRYMIDEMDRNGDFEFESGTAEGKDLADELSAEMEDLNLCSGPWWGTTVGNLAYWISPCADDECAPCPYVDADECATARERSVAGTSDSIPICIYHER